MLTNLIKPILQYGLPPILGIAVSWGMHQARLESLEKELVQIRLELGGHEKNEAWEDRFNELIQILNHLDAHLSRE